MNLKVIFSIEKSILVIIFPVPVISNKGEINLTLFNRLFYHIV